MVYFTHIDKAYITDSTYLRLLKPVFLTVFATAVHLINYYLFNFLCTLRVNN